MCNSVKADLPWRPLTGYAKKKKKEQQQSMGSALSPQAWQWWALMHSLDYLPISRMPAPLPKS